MGSSQSLLSSEVAVTLVVVAGAIGLGYTQLAPAASSTYGSRPSTAESSVKKGKKKTKKQPSAAAPHVEPPATPLTPAVVPFPAVIPGGFDGATTTEGEAPPESSKRAKPKKKKTKLASSTSSTQPDAAAPKGASASETLPDKPAKGKQGKQQELAPGLLLETRTVKQSFQSSASIDTDGSWTRVSSRRTREGPSADLTTTSASEADAVTGSSSPVAERTDDDEHIFTSRSLTEARRPLAERLLPKPRKTGVDDMLETPDHPTVARVMRVQPRPDEKPASGFSWGDYEDVRNDADVDGEDDDAGWGVVKSKRSRPERTDASPSSSQTQVRPAAPETLTKRQRQNASKREALKAGKAQDEKERLAMLAKHKRELEKERMAEQQKAGGGKKTSGGMTASVDERGKLVWE
ncbi:hypothetical protein FPV67DRAFT_1423426 [Lyophyllum atratum]|nr:hypothetical protein FPV67DRAFT_1423426 [Lyophyllum atratum]